MRGHFSPMRLSGVKMAVTDPATHGLGVRGRDDLVTAARPVARATGRAGKHFRDSIIVHRMEPVKPCFT